MAACETKQCVMMRTRGDATAPTAGRYHPGQGVRALATATFGERRPYSTAIGDGVRLYLRTIEAGNALIPSAEAQMKAVIAQHLEAVPFSTLAPPFALGAAQGGRLC